MIKKVGSHIEGEEISIQTDVIYFLSRSLLALSLAHFRTEKEGGCQPYSQLGKMEIAEYSSTDRQTDGQTGPTDDDDEDDG